MENLMDKVRALVQEGQERGFVTSQDIERHIPIEDWDSDLLDNIMTELQELGVEFLDDKAANALTEHSPALDDGDRDNFDAVMSVASDGESDE